jgi:hypothetical protein
MHVRTSLRAVGTILLLALLSPAAARAQDDKAVARARAYLENEERAKGILFFAHPTAEFQKLKLVQTDQVVDENNKVLRGHFVLTYRFSWKSGLFQDNHTTDLDFFFDAKGRFYKIDVGEKGTTTFIEPFTAANLVVKAVKDGLIKKVDKEGTAADRKLVRQLLQDADARGLLEWILIFDQK